MDYRVRSVGEFLGLVGRRLAALNYSVDPTRLANELNASSRTSRLQRVWLAARGLAAAALCAQVFSHASATISVSLPYSGVNFGMVNPNAVAPANVADRQLVITNNGDEQAWVTAFGRITAS